MKVGGLGVYTVLGQLTPLSYPNVSEDSSLVLSIFPWSHIQLICSGLTSVTEEDHSLKVGPKSKIHFCHLVAVLICQQ